MSDILVKAFEVQFDSCVTANLISCQNILVSRVSNATISLDSWLVEMLQND